jgi:hypothetical protein
MLYFFVFARERRETQKRSILLDDDLKRVLGLV